MNIQCKRVYDPAEQSDGYRVLVDRLWPRGIKKTDLALDEWDKEITPSTELRKEMCIRDRSISEAINKRSVTDVDSGESVSIPTEDISEPMFHQGRGGLRHRVHPGNDHFVQNDRIERPQGGGGGSGSGQGQACLLYTSSYLVWE